MNETALRSASLLVREKLLNCFRENILSIKKPVQEKKNKKNYLCTYQISKCNVPHINLSVLNVWAITYPYE